MISYISLDVLTYHNKTVWPGENIVILVKQLRLLINANPPLKFWGDSILIACYMVNRMPSSAFGNKILHSLVFPKYPLYINPSCVFGSTCLVHDFSPSRDKSSAQVVKCIFLGYSRV